MRSRYVALAILFATHFALAQETKAPFDAPVVGLGDLHRITQLGDFDQDGYVDGIGWWWTNSSMNAITVTMFRNINGKYVPQFSGSTFSLATTPTIDDTIGDFNGDSRDDYAYTFGSSIFIVFSTGLSGNAFSPPIGGGFSPSTLSNFQAVRAADFNGDGFDDLCVATTVGVGIVLSNGSGFPTQFTSVAFSSMSGAIELDIGDLDGDGDPDVIRTSNNAVERHITQNGILQSKTTVALASPNHMTTFGDIDGDGDGDITVFDASTYVVIRRTSTTTFVQETSRVGGPAYDLADVDGDGDLDGICCSGGSGSPTTIYITNPSTFHISLNDGTGNFAPAFTMPGLGSAHIAPGRDIDLDGDIDLVAGRCIYYSRGGISETPMPSTGLTTQNDFSPIDLDGDGDEDVDIGLGSFMQSNAAGEFATSAPILPAPPTGLNWANSMIPGDFDGDGDQDLIVATTTAGGTPGPSIMLLQMGGAAFQTLGNATTTATSVFPAGASASDYQAVTGDVDQDGNLDVLVSRYSLSNTPAPTICWHNNGGGLFSAVSLIADFIPSAVVDFTGDGIPDIIGCRTNWMPAVGVGNGNGTFNFAASNWILSTALFDATNPRKCVRAFDFQNDGDIDVIYLSLGGKIFVNNGSGWGTPLSLGIPGSNIPLTERRLIVGDFDNDGHSDLATNNAANTPDVVSIARWNPVTSNFDPVVMQTSDFDFAFDADRDGDTDLVGTRLIRGRKFHGPIAGAMRQYGHGYPGTGGITPQLSEVRPLRGGEVCEFKLTGGLGGSFAWVGYGLNPAAVPLAGYPGIELAVDPFLGVIPMPLVGPLNAPGEGSFTWTYEPPVGIGGFEVWVQAAVIDPGSPLGFSMTPGLHKFYGN